MGRPGFIINPPDRRSVDRWRPGAGRLPLWFWEVTTLWRKQPIYLGDIEGLRRPNGGAADTGAIVGVPYTPRMLKVAKKFNLLDHVMTRLVKAARLLVEGYDVDCLSFTGQIGGGTLGEKTISACLKDPAFKGVGLTTGNGLTVAVNIAAIIRELVRRDVNPNTVTVGIVGCYGSIGEAISRMMAGGFPELKDNAFPRFLLKGNSKPYLTERLAKELLRSGAHSAEPIDSLSRLVECDVVVAATNASHPYILDRYLKRGAIVCDLAVPLATHPSVLTGRRDVFVLNGLVKPPAIGEEVTYGFDFGLNSGLCYACMAEAMLGHVAPEARPSLTQTAQINMAKARNLHQLARAKGFGYETNHLSM